MHRRISSGRSIALVWVNCSAVGGFHLSDWSRKGSTILTSLSERPVGDGSIGGSWCASRQKRSGGLCLAYSRAMQSHNTTSSQAIRKTLAKVTRHDLTRRRCTCADGISYFRSGPQYRCLEGWTECAFRQKGAVHNPAISRAHVMWRCTSHNGGPKLGNRQPLCTRSQASRAFRAQNTAS